jgi:DNA polymerase III delta prime subunit
VCLRNAVSDFIGLNVLRLRKYALDSGGKTKEAFSSTYLIFLCTVFLSALSQATQRHCQHKIFQPADKDKTFKTNNNYNIDDLVTP